MGEVENSSLGTAEKVLVGEVTAPFGVRGQVKMRPLMDKPEVLATLRSVVLRYKDGREAVHRITGVRRHQEVVVLTFDGISDRDSAETLRGGLLLIEKSELPPLEADAYYEGQLLGLQVTTESGRDLGRIEQVHFYPANDVYETAVAMIPAVESIIVLVDLDAGRIVVRDMAGLRKDE
ncbi:MAG: 16S rRNA processing protein RimM [Cytophagales bacterium]|nr:16S rRNA processing protein RimM [Armatimonadota bacterium]